MRSEVSSLGGLLAVGRLGAPYGACLVYLYVGQVVRKTGRDRYRAHNLLLTCHQRRRSKGLALGWFSDLAVFPSRSRKSKLSPRAMHPLRSLLCVEKMYNSFARGATHE